MALLGQLSRPALGRLRHAATAGLGGVVRRPRPSGSTPGAATRARPRSGNPLGARLGALGRALRMLVWPPLRPARVVGPVSGGQRLYRFTSFFGVGTVLLGVLAWSVLLFVGWGVATTLAVDGPAGMAVGNGWLVAAGLVGAALAVPAGVGLLERRRPFLARPHTLSFDGRRVVVVDAASGAPVGRVRAACRAAVRALLGPVSFSDRCAVRGGCRTTCSPAPGRCSPRRSPSTTCTPPRSSPPTSPWPDTATHPVRHTAHLSDAGWTTPDGGPEVP